jgi:hypothetical protein
VGTSLVKLDAEARATAGTLGDAVSIALTQPGVARPALGTGQLVLWGSAPSESRIYVDDIPIPYLFHRGGLRGSVHAELVSSLEVTPAAYGASYGRGLGGIVRLRTQSLAPPSLDTESTPSVLVNGVASLDALDGSAALQVRQAEQQGPWSLTAGGRYGWLSALASALPTTRVSEAFPIPSYGDGFLKVIHRDEGGLTELTAFGSLDHIDRQVTDARGARSRMEDQHFLRVMLRRTWAGGSALAWVGRDYERARLRFPGASAERDASTLRAGVRVQRSLFFSRTISLRVGAEMEIGQASSERSGSLSTPEREGDLAVFGQAPASRIGQDAWTVHTFEGAPFAELESKVSEVWTVTPGVRLETLGMTIDRLRPRFPGGVEQGGSSLKVFVDPRLRTDVKLSSRLTVTGAAGRYHQGADAADLSPLFGNPTLAPGSAWHALTGVSWQVAPSLALDWSVFAKWADALAARSDRLAPLVAENLQNRAAGRAVGGQVTLRLPALGPLSGFVSYTLTRSERQEGTSWRPTDFDQPHALTVVANLALAKRWRLGTRVRVTSGVPRARVVGAVYDARLGDFQPLRSGRERLDAFAQADVHLERFGALGPFQYSLYVDVLNAFNRENPEDLAYSSDYRDRRVLTGYPFLAFLGLRVEK